MRLACSVDRCEHGRRVVAVAVSAADRWTIAGLAFIVGVLALAAAWLGYIAYLVAFGGFLR